MCIRDRLTPVVEVVQEPELEDTDFDVTFAPTSTVVADDVDVGGDLNESANWLRADGTVGFPVDGETAIINVDSSLDVGGGASMFGAMGDLVFDGGGTLTALAAGSLTGTQGDLVGSNPSSYTFNDHTVNTADDIFAFGSVYTFNEGSTTNVGDDFQANGTCLLYTSPSPRDRG